jgi:hypothetical protein
VSGVRIEVVRHTQTLERFNAVLSSLVSPWGFGNMAESSLSAKVTSLTPGKISLHILKSTTKKPHGAE